MEKLTIRAVLTGDNQNAKNYGGDKETISTLKVIVKVDKKLRVVCDARFYMGRSARSSTVYCSLWVSGKGVCVSGTGKAGGYGYHKQSAALADAIESAGIKLYDSNYAQHDGTINLEKNKFTRSARIARIAGCGDTGSMEMALKAIAKTAGATGEYLIVG